MVGFLIFGLMIVGLVGFVRFIAGLIVLFNWNVWIQHIKKDAEVMYVLSMIEHLILLLTSIFGLIYII